MICSETFPIENDAAGAASPSLAKDTVEIRFSDLPELGSTAIVGRTAHLPAANRKVLRGLPAAKRAPAVAGIAAITNALGSRLITNEDIAVQCPQWTPERIERMTGIRQRYWVGENETAVTLAVKAASDLLASEGLSLFEIDAIYCATGSPIAITPSNAALILGALSMRSPESPLIQVTDVSSACCGYLYALQAAWDTLHFDPAAKVLVITTETLSRRLTPQDPATFPLFADAATATLLVGAANSAQMLVEVERPVLSGMGEAEPMLRVPLLPQSPIHMDGPRVFSHAIKFMLQALGKALAGSHMNLADLDLVIPHQCNQRIIEAFRQKAKLPATKVFSNIARYGNTSSSSIPLCLANLLANRCQEQLVGLCAFGGGLTFGGAVARVLPKGASTLQ